LPRGVVDAVSGVLRTIQPIRVAGGVGVVGIFAQLAQVFVGQDRGSGEQTQDDQGKTHWVFLIAVLHSIKHDMPGSQDTRTGRPNRVCKAEISYQNQ
jgi:hypothetical protein